jgi:acetyl-CoA carboxylase biotin carboxylase subunit
MFRKVLVANRGEIAVRVLRSLKELSIPAVAVYTDVDAGAVHRRFAPEAVAIGAPRAYLDIERLIDAARQMGCDAVHPGYGFLSENAPFAEACRKANLTFIGPTPETISQMGDKTRAREIAARAGVPLVPGTDKGLSDEQLAKEAQALGFPVLIKAAAGGGGKGMRIVREPVELKDALAGARHEAQRFFNDGSVFLERYIERPRHIEIQLLADHHGHVVHCLERECSIQRRHQKIIEECPSPILTPVLRAEMGAAAVALAKETGYRNAGTVEFLLDDKGRFYFLEVNTRLQVEHPVTEQVTGLDLVAWQLAIASGEKLTIQQADIQPRGHAIEVRVYAEDPAKGYMPSPGTILSYTEPTGPGVRVDSGVRAGSVVSAEYDPMLSKLIAYAPDRDAARRRLLRAIGEYQVLGVKTNLSLLAWIAAHPEYAKGETDTGFLVRNPPPQPAPDAALARIAAIAAALAEETPITSGSGTADRRTPAGPFATLGARWLG